MARARLPHSIPGKFVVLRYDSEQEKLSVWFSDTESHVIGDNFDARTGDFSFDPTGASKQLQRWGIDNQTANDAVDQALEFKTVQVIPSERRVINLIPRGTDARDAILEHAFAVQDEGPRQYAYLP